MAAPRQTTAKKTTPKAPQDRQPKRTRDDAPIGEDVTTSAHLEVTIDGETYRSTRPITDVMTVGLVRRLRHDETELTFTVLERLFEDQPEALEAVDGLSITEWAGLADKMMSLVDDDQGASLGESSRSST